MTLSCRLDAFSPEALLDQEVPKSSARYACIQPIASDCGLVTDELYTSSDWDRKLFEEAIKCARYRDAAEHVATVAST